MNEEDKKPKTTLIKHTKNSTETPNETQPAKKEGSSHSRPGEKKKVVVVKKRVVVVKPQAKPSTEEVKTPEADSSKTSTGKKPAKDTLTEKSTEPEKPKMEGSPKSTVVKHEHPTIRTRRVKNTHEPFRRTPNAGVSTPKVIDPKDLPPVPGQGQTAHDHVEWRKNNQHSLKPKESTGSRQVGQVGGFQNRPQNNDRGSRPPYQNNRGGAPGSRPPYQNRDGQGRPPFNSNRNGQRPPYNSGRPNYNNNGSRPPYNNSGRPNSFNNRGPRPQRPGAGGPPRDENIAQKTSKKVFKKRKNFQRPERDNEKDFQIKRKDVHRANPVPKKIDIMEVITVSDLAKKMNLKASEVIGKLLKMGMMVTINQQIDSDVATLIANEYNCEVNIVSLYDETLIQTEDDAEQDVIPRAPIVTIMGHVDHGKTKLLDAIRSTDVVADEFGGITQHIGAYKVSLADKGNIVFLDTPGHAAFTLMRARGAQVTDIVVLVVAANDGVMPQTIEAIDHAKAAKVPIIVAVNKIDLVDANIDRVKQQLSDHGLMPEDWGGTTLYCELSALKKIGIEDLLDTILLQAEMLELKANPKVRAEGKVLESRIDQGRGIVASIIVERGTLHQGDNFVAGIYPGKVRAMFDDRGKKISEAGPATPVEIIGLSDIPGAGDPFQVTENEKQARQVGSKRQELERLGQAKNVKKVTLDNIFDKLHDGTIQEFNVIIKGDVQGSVEAVQHALEKLSTDEIRLNAIRASAGAIIEDDINLAIASNALVLGFNVRPTPRAQTLAEREKIEIRKYNIIYDAVDDIRDAMEGMLAPERSEVVIGEVEVRDTFKVPKIGTIAGCYVTSGKIRRNAQVNVIRDSIKVYTGKISSLKRFKDDARDVAEGFECGVGLENFQDLRPGDILEVIDVVEKKRQLKRND
ncbi:MAG: translation initiation factor IF-2 [Sphaerochaetaceae bacterium]|nr:translation initiation factor IF-2 [Sphaerochaetaceae bacterium]